MFRAVSYTVAAGPEVKYSATADRWLWSGGTAATGFTSGQVEVADLTGDFAFTIGQVARVGEAVFTADGATLFVTGPRTGTGVASLHAIDAVTGTENWSLDLPLAATGTDPLIADAWIGDDSRWLYLMSGCPTLSLIVVDVDAHRLVAQSRIDGTTLTGFICWKGTLLGVTESDRNSLYFVLSDGGDQSLGNLTAVIRFLIP